LNKITSKVFGWKENFRETLSKILNYQKYNDVEFITITFSPNGFLTLEEKSLKTILLGFNPKRIENQLQIVNNMKNQIKENNILEKIDNIDLTDPNNPKIKVFKP
jgi:cell division protein FtsQ